MLLWPHNDNIINESTTNDINKAKRVTVTKRNRLPGDHRPVEIQIGLIPPWWNVARFPIPTCCADDDPTIWDGLAETIPFLGCKFYQANFIDNNTQYNHKMFL